MNSFTITNFDGEEVTVHLEVDRDEEYVTVQSVEKFQGYPFYMLTADAQPYEDEPTMTGLSYSGWNATSVSTDYKTNDFDCLRKVAEEEEVPTAMIDLMIETLKSV